MAKRPLARDLRVVWLLAFALGLPPVLVAGPIGCGGESEEAGGEDGKPKTRGEALRSGTIRELTNHANILADRVEKTPLDYKGIAAECREYAPKAAAVKATDLVERFQQIEEEDAKAAFARAAASETKKGLDEARKMLGKGEIDDAKDKLARLLSRVRGTEHAAAVEEELAQASLVGRGGKVYENVIDKKLTDPFEGLEIKGEWEKARGLLESFLLVEAFKLHPRAKDVEAKLAEIEPKADEARKRRLAEQAIEWQPIFNGKKEELENGFYDVTPYEAVELDGSHIRFESKSEPAQIVVGDLDWGDVMVEVTFKLTEGQGLFYARLGTESAGTLVTNVETWQVAKGREFVKVRVTARGDTARYTLFGPSPDEGTIGLDAPAGLFRIGLAPNSTMEIKSIWAKVLTRVELPD